MSRQIAADGTPYTPRRGGSGTTGPVIRRVRRRALAALSARRLLAGREKDLVRQALAGLSGLSKAIGQAAQRQDQAETDQLNGQRDNLVAQLTLLLDQAEERATAASRHVRMMTGKPRAR